MFKIKNFNWLFIAILMQQIAREVGCCVFSPFQFKSHSSYNLWAVPMMNIKFNYMSCIVIINRTSDLSCQYILVPKWARGKNNNFKTEFLSHLDQYATERLSEIRIITPHTEWICMFVYLYASCAHNYYHYVYYFN